MDLTLPKRSLLLIIVCLLAGISGCGVIQTSPPEQTFEGILTYAFEVSSFRPCGSENDSWFTAPAESGFWEKYQALGPFQAGEQGTAYVYTRFTGTLASGDPNGYGHLGQYQSEVTVKEVLEIRPAIPGECP